MKELVKILKERLERGKASMLVTVVEDKGSAPRSAGACMAVGGEGRLTGTIGGGMLEFRAIETARKNLEDGRGELKEYRLTKDEVAGLGMVCGGDVDVLFTYLPPEQAIGEVLAKMEKHLRGHRTGWLLLPLEGGIGFLSEEEGLYGKGSAPDKAQLAGVEAGVLETEGGKCYVQKVMNLSRVYVFGGGHLAQELVPLLSHLGFRCIVTDDREEYSTRELFPDAEELHTYAYTELDGKFDVQPQDYIVSVTRGHMGDYEVQCFGLKTPAYYIGVVGSRSKIAAVNEKLKAEGFSDQDIARITAPIGLDIKSETPAEIAVSIAAQLIERRASYHKKDEK